MIGLARSDFEQVEGLKLVQAKVPGSVIKTKVGDVPALIFGNREICFASGGYDLWINGHMSKQYDLDLDGAVKALKKGKR